MMMLLVYFTSIWLGVFDLLCGGRSLTSYST